jgi:hypothetical protein
VSIISSRGRGIEQVVSFVITLDKSDMFSVIGGGGGRSIVDASVAARTIDMAKE